MRFVSVTFSIALISSAGVALAEAPVAQLSSVQGTVAVDVGEGFVPVVAGSDPMQLKLGDRVMLTKDGGGMLSYGSDCSIPLVARP